MYLMLNLEGLRGLEKRRKVSSLAFQTKSCKVEGEVQYKLMAEAQN
jgi:hypothetical protein